MTLEELDSAAAERPEYTSELFRPNDYYGFATVIKKYSGLSPDYALPGIVPHGTRLTAHVWEPEINHPLPNLLLESRHDQEVYARITKKSSYAIGAPFYYALRQMGSEGGGRGDKPSGTIVLPAHSTHHVTAVFDQERFIDYLKTLGEEFQPLTICLYWRDVQLGRHRKYIEAGFPTVTAGHMFDHDFLYRLVRILAPHRYCFVNEIGTGALYSAAMGLPVRIFEQQREIVGDNEDRVRESSCTDVVPLARDFHATAGMSLEEAVPVQERLAKEALGYESLLEPGELRALLERLTAEIKQKWAGVASKPTATELLRYVDQARGLLNTGKTEQAFQVLNEIKTLRIPTSGLEYLRAVCFLLKNEGAAAIEALKEELNHFPGNAAAREWLGKLGGQVHPDGSTEMQRRSEEVPLMPDFYQLDIFGNSGSIVMEVREP